MDISAFWQSIGVGDPYGTGSARQQFLITLAREAGTAAGRAYAEAMKPAPHPLVGRRVEVTHTGSRGTVESVHCNHDLIVAFGDGTADAYHRRLIRLLPDAE